MDHQSDNNNNEPFEELKGYYECDHTLLTMKEHFRYTKNKYKLSGRECKYGIVVGRNDDNYPIVSCYKPKPHYKPFVLDPANTFKCIRYYKKRKIEIVDEFEELEEAVKIDGHELLEGELFGYTTNKYQCDGRKLVSPCILKHKDGDTLVVNHVNGFLKDWNINLNNTKYQFYRLPTA